MYYSCEGESKETNDIWRYGQVVRQWIANPRFPSSNLGAIILSLDLFLNILYVNSYWECGGIGRHDGLKIRCLVIGVRVQVPPFPFYLQAVQ
jgi:hypothetical protein